MHFCKKRYFFWRQPSPLRHFTPHFFFLSSHSFFFFSAAPSAVLQLHIVQKVSATAFQNEKIKTSDQEQRRFFPGCGLLSLSWDLQRRVDSCRIKYLLNGHLNLVELKDALMGKKLFSLSKWNFPSCHEMNFSVRLGADCRSISLEMIIYIYKNNVIFLPIQQQSKFKSYMRRGGQMLNDLPVALTVKILLIHSMVLAYI